MQIRRTDGLDPSRRTRKPNSRIKTKGLRQIQDHTGKALGEENPDLLCIFCVICVWPLFQNYFPNNVKTKNTRQHQIRLVKSLRTEVSCPSEVPWFVRESFLITHRKASECVLDNLELVRRLSTIKSYISSVHNNNF